MDVSLLCIRGISHLLYLYAYIILYLSTPFCFGISTLFFIHHFAPFSLIFCYNNLLWSEKIHIIRLSI